MHSIYNLCCSQLRKGELPYDRNRACRLFEKTIGTEIKNRTRNEDKKMNCTVLASLYLSKCMDRVNNTDAQGEKTDALPACAFIAVGLFFNCMKKPD